jgi:hypothetical protein
MGVEYSLQKPSYTPSAVADASALAAGGTWDSYIGAAAPFVARIVEVFEGGEATASTVNVMALRRTSTAGTGAATAGSTTKLNNSSPAIRGTHNSAFATTGPTPNGGHALNLSLNVFGGIVRWSAAPGEEVYLIGNGTDGDITLSAVSGTPGLLSSHIVVEEM